MSDTPRTDEQAVEAITGLGTCVGVNFARQLERDLIDAEEKIVELEEELDLHAHQLNPAIKMSKPWVKTIRRESGLVELVCKCGVGHPAYGSVHWLKLHGKDGYEVHGCCGCCRTPEWQLADAREGVEIANGLVKRYWSAYRKSAAHIADLQDKIFSLTPASAALRPSAGGG